MRSTTVTPDEVRGIKPDFKQFSDDYIEGYIKTAQVRVCGDGMDSPYGVNDEATAQVVYDAAVLQYARHLLSVDLFMQHNGVTSATVMNNSQTITDKTLSDPYLAEYNRMLNLYGTSMMEKGFAVFYD